jgi:predicted sugar kinase
MYDAEIALHLANIEMILKDIAHNARIFGFTGLGLAVGCFGGYVIFREIAKKW